MRRVVKSEQVAHLWANKSQSDARNANRSLWFKGDSIWSYGLHYELGRHITYNGEPLVMINTKGYSVTTRKQIRMVQDATKHLLQLDSKIGLDQSDVRQTLVDRQDAVISELMYVFSRRKFFCTGDEWCADRSDKLVEFNNLCKKLGHYELTVEMPTDFWVLCREHIKYRSEQETIADTLKAAKREIDRAKEAESLKGHLTNWLAGWITIEVSLHAFDPQHIRVKGDYVETTRGANVPLRAAKLFMQLLDTGRIKPGDKVGSFPFESYDAKTGIITIGCHRFDIKQVREALK